MPSPTNHPTRRDRALRTALAAISSPAMATSRTAEEAIEPHQREAMIREAAYFLAENRGFCGGCEMDDWLAAEQQIERALTHDGAANALSS